MVKWIRKHRKTGSLSRIALVPYAVDITGKTKTPEANTKEYSCQ